jgi:hypothetical protein
LTDVVFIEKTVDPAIFLIQRNEQRDWVTSLVGNGLEFLDELRCLMGSCRDQYVLKVYIEPGGSNNADKDTGNERKAQADSNITKSNE